MVSRRGFVKLCGGLAAGFWLPIGTTWPHNGGGKHAGSPALRKFVDALPLLAPAMQPTGTHEGAPLYDIAARSFRQRLHRDLPATTLWGYDGRYPGPTLEARRDQRLFVRWRNELTESGFLLPHVYDPHLHGTHAGEPPTKTVVHLHGAVVQPDSDGRPDAWYTAGFGQRGAEWTREVYEYPNRQEACALWYHDHAIGQTRLNVYAGLAGMYLIRDDEEQALGLPRGEYEVPLLIQDRSFAADGSLIYPVAEAAGQPDHPGPWVPEFFGDTIVVNGKVWPYCEVEPRRYRLRILNGSNARFYRLQFSDGRPFTQIGTDQGLLRAPVEIRRLLLAPAERADVIVDFRGARGKSIRLLNNAPAPFPKGDAANPRTVGQIMQFRVTKTMSAADSTPVPARLRPVAPLPEQGATVRPMAMREYMDAKGEPIVVLLNGRKWDGPITVRPRLGSTEIWQFINPTADAHPMHLHLVRFQVLDRQPFAATAYLKAWGAKQPGAGPDPIAVERYLRGSRQRPAPAERGWKDTVIAYPGQVARIIARFDGYTGKYPWHCHMLEHEDNEMMLQFEVVA